MSDLPAGHRWANEEECERYASSPSLLPGAIVVPRTTDHTGRPYTQDEADLAVPLDSCTVKCGCDGRWPEHRRRCARCGMEDRKIEDCPREA